MPTQNEPSRQRIVEPDEIESLGPGESLEESLTVKPTEEGTSPQSTEESTIPEKFKGKSVEDVVEMYNNLQTKFGQQGNELGELRGLTDKILLQNLVAQNTPPAETEKTIEDEDYLINPKETIERLVQEQVKPIADKLDSKSREEAIQALEAKHPDMEQIVLDEGFQAWILDSPARESNWGKAAQGDFIQADDLFSTYKALHKKEEVAQPAAATPEVDEAALQTATAMSTGTSSDAKLGVQKGQVFSRRRLVQLQVESPDKYAALGPEITRAYEQGRVVD
jgi:hypothetical protein